MVVLGLLGAREGRERAAFATAFSENPSMLAATSCGPPQGLLERKERNSGCLDCKLGCFMESRHNRCAAARIDPIDE